MSGLSADLYSVRAALEQLPTVCRYHGDDFGKLGFEGPNFGAEPRCESCRPAWRRMAGLAALERVGARLRPRCSAVYHSNLLGVDIPCIREVGHGGDHRTDDASGALEWPS